MACAPNVEVVWRGFRRTQQGKPIEGGRQIAQVNISAVAQTDSDLRRPSQHRSTNKQTWTEPIFYVGWGTTATSLTQLVQLNCTYLPQWPAILQGEMATLYVNSPFCYGWSGVS